MILFSLSIENYSQFTFIFDLYSSKLKFYRLNNSMISHSEYAAANCRWMRLMMFAVKYVTSLTPLDNIVYIDSTFWKQNKPTILPNSLQAIESNNTSFCISSWYQFFEEIKWMQNDLKKSEQNWYIALLFVVSQLSSLCVSMCLWFFFLFGLQHVYKWSAK